MGQHPPGLPAEGWIDTEPLSWEKLKGRKVLLYFWSRSCGPCHNFFGILNERHKSAKQTGAVYIGLHEATQDRPAVEAAVAKDELKFPVLIDRAVPGKRQGELFDWFHVSAMPYIILIDQDGKMVGHAVGTIGSSEIWKQFGDLASSRR